MSENSNDKNVNVEETITSAVIKKTKEKKKLKFVVPILGVIGHIVLIGAVIIIIFVLIIIVLSMANNILNIFSSDNEYEKVFVNALPNHIYIDNRLKETESTDEFINSEINKLSEIIAATSSVTNYFASIETSEIDKNIIFNDSLKDICILSYAGLVDTSNTSYFNNMLNNLEELDQFDYKKLNDENKLNCPNVNFSLVSAKDHAKKLSENLALDSIGYSFNIDTFKQFLKKYYFQYRYQNILNKVDNTKFDEIINNHLEEITLYFDTTKNKIKQDLINYYETGAGSEFDSFNELFNIYGTSNCSYLEEFSNENHPFALARGVDSDKVYSIYDGEVIYVKNNQVNLYDHYDFKTKKCLCANNICENYDGNEIKIRFKIDRETYIATYSHLSLIYVEEGSFINKGDLIGIEGNTGCTNYKNLKFKIENESGYAVNPSELLKNCSSMINTFNSCDFQNIKIYTSNEKSIDFYEYIKQELYKNFKKAIDNKEILKAGAVILTTKFLHDNDYKVGIDSLYINNYLENSISEIDENKLDKAISEVVGEVLLYSSNFANVKFSNICTRDEYDTNANEVYNEFCIKSALNINKNYDELLKIFFPKFNLAKNYCLDYASKINLYKLDNNKKELNIELTDIEKEDLDAKLKSRIESVGPNSRASVVEAARFLTLGYEFKIPYKNGGKYFSEGFNKNWFKDGLDSSGFVSWCLLNGKGKITEQLNINELINNNTIGNLKIDQDLYNYYDKIQVGDLAYQNSKIGLIIGKNNGILYVAESDKNMGLIVTTITSYGLSDSNYTHIYFADDYYETNGNITNMW